MPRSSTKGILDSNGPILDDQIKLPENQRPAGPGGEELFTAWKDKPSPKTLSPLMDSLAPTISSALSTYGYSGDPNIAEAAKLHVISVLPRFDPSKAKMETFLRNELRRVQRLGPQMINPIQSSERARLDNRFLVASEMELREQLGRDPTLDELCDHCGLSPKRIERIRMASRPLMAEDSLSGGEDQAPQVIGTSSGRPEDVWMEAYYASLEDPKDKLIFEYSTGWRGRPITGKSAIAAKLGLSPGAVSQRADRMAAALQGLINSGNKLV